MASRKQNFGEKHLKSLEHNHTKAPFFGKYIDDIAAILLAEHRYLAHLTVELINWFIKTLDIKAELIRSSSLGVEGRKVELLVSICKSVGAECYLSPVGSQAYIEESNLFPENAIELKYQAFEHPEYKQLHCDFIPYMSVIDLLFNEGEHSLKVIRSGRRLGR